MCFSMAANKSCERRPGYEATSYYTGMNTVLVVMGGKSA